MTAALDRSQVTDTTMQVLAQTTVHPEGKQVPIPFSQRSLGPQNSVANWV